MSKTRLGGDFDQNVCTCGCATNGRAKVAELRAEIERLRANNIDWAKRNLREVRSEVAVDINASLLAEIERLRVDRDKAVLACRNEIQELRATIDDRQAENERLRAFINRALDGEKG